MAINQLSDLHDWTLVHDEQDIRGWDVHDEAGQKVGTVTDLVADTDQELITAIVLDNGERFPAREIQIADGIVHVRGTHAGTDRPVVKMYDDARVRRNTAGTTVLFTDYSDTFRSHHETNYSDNDYSVYEPAYRMGFDYAMKDEYASRNYGSVEPDLRRDYEKKHGEGTWDKAKDAARHAFEKARNLGHHGHHGGTDRTTTGTTTGTTTRTTEGVR